jgi:outer membrane protein TolC
VGKALAAQDALRGRIIEVRAQALPEVNINGGSLRWRDPSLLNASGIENFPKELQDALVPRGINMFSYNIALKQPLYTAGKVGTALKLASIEAEGAASEIDRARQDLAANVVRAYYSLLLAAQNLALAQEEQQQRIEHAVMARTRFENGVATEVDVLRSQVAVANGRPEIARAEGAVRQARALLNFYLVRPIDAPVRLTTAFEEKPAEEGTLEQLAFEALRRRPEIVRLRIAERSAEAQLKLAHAENRARLDLTSEYGIMARLPENLLNSKFTRWTLGVNFTLPAFDGFKRNGLVAQAVAHQRTARLEREKNEQQVRLAVQQALDEFATARESLNAAKENVSQAGKVLQMMRNNYKWGAATTLDITDSQVALSVARSNVLRGLHDLSVARANLRWAMGMTPWE